MQWLCGFKDVSCRTWSGISCFIDLRNTLRPYCFMGLRIGFRNDTEVFWSTFDTKNGVNIDVFMEFLDRDAEVERSLKIHEFLHAFAVIYYLRQDGLVPPIIRISWWAQRTDLCARCRVSLAALTGDLFSLLSWGKWRGVGYRIERSRQEKVRDTDYNLRSAVRNGHSALLNGRSTVLNARSAEANEEIKE